MSRFYRLHLSHYQRIKCFQICLVYLLEQVCPFFHESYDKNNFQVGLALSTAANMLGMLQWGIRQSSETENHLTSIECLLEYAKLEPEPSLATDEVKFTRKNAKDKLNSILSDDNPKDVQMSGKSPVTSIALEKIEKGSSKMAKCLLKNFHSIIILMSRSF